LSEWTDKGGEKKGVLKKGAVKAVDDKKLNS